MHFEKNVIWSKVRVPWDSVRVCGEVITEGKGGLIRKVARRFISVFESDQNSNENGENDSKL